MKQINSNFYQIFPTVQNKTINNFRTSFKDLFS